MDHRVLRERDLDIDLESCGMTSEDDTTNDIVPANRQTNKLVDIFWNGMLSLDGLVSSSKSGQVSDDNVGLLINKSSEAKEDQLQLTFWDRMHGEEKRKKTNFKKPPRPPNGPSLDAADQKLVKEIAELAMRKRSRIERIKALKKLRASKASSWNSSLSAMVITVLFCLIVIFHGLFTRNGGSVLSRPSPKPAFPGTEDLISIQVYNFSASEGSDDPHSGSPSLAEKHVSGSGSGKK